MIQRFIDYISIERHYSTCTANAYERDLKDFATFLKTEDGDLDLNLIDEGDIRAWMIDMMDKGMSVRTVKRRLSSLCSYAKYCLKVGLTSKDITKKIIAPKADKPLPVFYKESEMTAVRATEKYADDFESKRDNLIIEMFYQTGMRRAELIGLEDKDVDTTQMQVRIFGKRRKERLVPIGTNLVEQINEYLEFREQAIEQLPERFLCNKKGRALSSSKVYQIVHERMSEVSTQKKQSPHVLRHTFATQMLNNGADINTIKTLMGHASLDATQVYTHTTFEQIRKAYEKAHPRERKN